VTLPLLLPLLFGLEQLLMLWLVEVQLALVQHLVLLVMLMIPLQESGPHRQQDNPRRSTDTAQSHYTQEAAH
jgi:hypothetical protein